MAIPSPPKMSPKTRYFLAVFAVTFFLLFCLLHFGDGYSRFHPGVPVEGWPVVRAAAFALLFGLLMASFMTKKRF